MARPDWIEMVWPATFSAATTRRASNPMNSPMATSARIKATSAAVVSTAGKTGATMGVRMAVTSSANAIRMRGEMRPSPKPGNVISIDPMRAKAVMKTSTCALRKASSAIGLNRR